MKSLFEKLQYQTNTSMGRQQSQVYACDWISKSSSEVSCFIKSLHAVKIILSSVKTWEICFFEILCLKNKSYFFAITEHIKGTSSSKGSRLKICTFLGFSRVCYSLEKGGKAEFNQLLCCKSNWVSFKMPFISFGDYKISTWIHKYD